MAASNIVLPSPFAPYAGLLTLIGSELPFTTELVSGPDARSPEPSVTTSELGVAPPTKVPTAGLPPTVSETGLPSGPPTVPSVPRIATFAICVMSLPPPIHRGRLGRCVGFRQPQGQPSRSRLGRPETSPKL